MLLQLTNRNGTADFCLFIIKMVHQTHRYRQDGDVHHRNIITSIPITYIVSFQIFIYLKKHN